MQNLESKLQKSFSFLHNFLLLAIFVGLLFLSGMSLIALSPVAYEDYLAYNSDLENENLISDQRSRVAGVSYEHSNDYEIINSLADQNISYNFEKTEKSAVLNVRIEQTDEVDVAYRKNLPVLRFQNNSYLPKQYKILMSYSGVKESIPGLAVQPLGYLRKVEGIVGHEYVLDLPGQSVIDLNFVRSFEAPRDLDAIASDFSVEISAIMLEEDSEQGTSGRNSVLDGSLLP